MAHAHLALILFGLLKRTHLMKPINHYIIFCLTYLQHFAILIERNILKDSNHCFNFLSIRQQSEDLKQLISVKWLPELQG